MSPEEIDAVLGHLTNGCTYRGACKRAGVTVEAFRATRRSDSTLQLRTDRARAAGLRQVAKWLREKAARNEALAQKLAPTFEDWVLL